jgi:outer membrane protein assembly factor BamB
LYAIDIQQGRLHFTTSVGRGRINRPAVENGMIFVSTGEMHALYLHE